MNQQLLLGFCSSSKSRRLDRLALCELVLSAEKAPPDWICLVPAGDKIQALDGRKFGNPNPDSIVEMFNADPRKVPIDYEHSTEIKAPNGEPAPAAGWIVAMEVRDGAVWGQCEWNPNGISSLTNHEYKYLSPAFEHTKSGVITKIVSSALTNRPALDMPELAHSISMCMVEKRDGKWVVLSESGDMLGEHDTEEEAEKQLQAIEASKHSSKGSASAQEKPMDPKLLSLLGLAADATVDQVIKAITEIKDSSSKTASELKASQDALATARAVTPSLDKFVPRSDFDAALARASAAEKQIQDEKKAAHDKAVNDEVDAACVAKKITPASKDFYLSTCASEEGLTKFREFIKGAPVVVPDSGIDDKPKPTGSDEPKVTDEALAIAARCNVTKEKFIATASAK